MARIYPPQLSRIWMAILFHTRKRRTSTVIINPLNSTLMKKIFLQTIAVLAFLGGSYKLYSQPHNIPDGSSLTTTASATAIQLPLGYTSGANQSYSNAALSTPKLNYSRTWV